MRRTLSTKPNAKFSTPKPFDFHHSITLLKCKIYIRAYVKLEFGRQRKNRGAPA